MARPKQFDDEALLESMRETFLDIGPGASTQELARRAGVSEGTLFKRFVSKRRMFTESLRMPELEEQTWFMTMLPRAGKGPIEEHLAEIALGLHRHVSVLMPCAQMIAANGKLKPQDFARLLGMEEEAPPFVMLKTVTAFFQREMDLGRVKRTDAEGLARMFIGAVVHDVNIRIHFPDIAPGDDVSVSFKIARTIAELASPGEEIEADKTLSRPLKKTSRSGA